MTATYEHEGHLERKGTQAERAQQCFAQVPAPVKLTNQGGFASAGRIPSHSALSGFLSTAMHMLNQKRTIFFF